MEFNWLSDARLILSDDLIKQMLKKKNTKTTILNEENFDEIETQLESNED